MSDISLTASMRTNLLSLQNTQSLMDTTQERLSTGKKVNSAIDNPSSYYTAQNLTNRAGDLEGLFVEQAKAVANTARDTSYKGKVESSGTFTAVDGQKVTIKVGNETIESNELSTDDGIEALVTAFTSAANYGNLSFTVAANADKTGIIVKAKDGTEITADVSIENGMGLSLSGEIDTTTRKNSIDQYNDILAQIDQLASDASYKGVNLLKGDELKVIFNESFSTKTVARLLKSKARNMRIRQDWVCLLLRRRIGRQMTVSMPPSLRLKAPSTRCATWPPNLVTTTPSSRRVRTSLKT